MRLPDVSFASRAVSTAATASSGRACLRCASPCRGSIATSIANDYERDKERQKSAEQEREDQVLMVREELHHLAVGIEATRREALLYSDEISARAAQALTSRLANGRPAAAHSATVLDARRLLLESQLMSARATQSSMRCLPRCFFGPAWKILRR